MFSFTIVEDLNLLAFSEPVFINVVSTDDSLHGANSRPSLVFVSTLKTHKVFLIPIEHNECVNFIEPESAGKWLKGLTVEKFVMDKKRYLHFFEDYDCKDVKLMNFLGTSEVIDEEKSDTQAHTSMKNRCFRLKNLNISIPLLKHVEKNHSLLTESTKVIKKYESDLNLKINDDFMPQLYNVEKQGLCVDINKLIKIWGELSKKHVKGNLIFTEYNFYIGTGRASNRFGGINYAALNKDKGEREPFISRHENGYLVMFDYSAFHPRLITTLVNYDIPYDVNIYEYLGKHYFKKNSLTKEEQDEAKILTFKLLYGGITKEYMDIDYFKKIHTFSENLWESFKANGYIETPIFGKKIKAIHIPNPFPSKLFNYMLQAYESEVGSQVIGELQKFLENKKTKLVLYQYDGFLFDFDFSEGKEVLEGIRDIMVMDKRFPLKVKAGKNFQDLVEIKV